MVSLDEAKSYLRVDSDDENITIQSLINASEAYIRASVTDFEKKTKNNEFVSCVKMIELLLISEWYDKRCFTIKEKENNINTIAKSIMLQMEYGNYE